MFKKWLKRVLIGLGVVFVLLQLVPQDRENPPVTLDIGAPPAVDAVLRRSCYDCHSNEVRWPWYAYVAPASFLVTQDVADARYVLNLSEWDTYDEGLQISLIEDIVDHAEEGVMPPEQYTLVHRDAVLSEADVDVLRQWARDLEEADLDDR